jgi:hypothetical protein
MEEADLEDRLAKLLKVLRGNFGALALADFD